MKDRNKRCHLLQKIVYKIHMYIYIYIYIYIHTYIHCILILCCNYKRYHTKCDVLQYSINLLLKTRTTLEARRLRDQIEVFKILNGYENI